MANKKTTQKQKPLNPVETSVRAALGQRDPGVMKEDVEHAAARHWYDDPRWDSESNTGHDFRVPKCVLIGSLQVALQNRLLKIAADLPEAATLIKGVGIFQGAD